MERQAKGRPQPAEDGPGTHITVPGNFMGLPGRLGEYDFARYVVLPIPYDATTCYKAGTRNGPAAIIDASQQVEWFDEELLEEFVQAGIATMGAVEAVVDSAAAQMQRIREVAGPIVGDGKFLLSLGGEHSVSAPLIELVHQRHPGLCVLQIDAHADLRDQYQGSRHSHACVMRRAYETTGKLVQVGIRNLAREEHDFLTAKGMKLFSPQVIASEPDWIDQVLSRLTGPVYITVDVDGFDPGVAPGTGTPEPGGLTWQQGLSLLRRVCAEREVVAGDIVEVLPLPGNHVTEFMAARLAYKLIAYTQAGR